MKRLYKKRQRSTISHRVKRRRRIGLRSQRNFPGNQQRSTTETAELIQAVEGILFIAREPLTSVKIAQYAKLQDVKETDQLINQLNQRYDKAHHAFRIEEVAGGFQFMSRPLFSRWLKRLDYVPQPHRFSSPSIETLAVIAYRQPALRAEIEAIRGVGCGEVIRQLMERDMVRIAGRSEDLGRPYLYATTKKFLSVFGLGSIKDLPPIEVSTQAPQST